MKRAGSPLKDDRLIHRLEALVLAKKRSESLVDIYGYNWNDFIERLIFGGFCCPFASAWDDTREWRSLHVLYNIYNKHHSLPVCCWCKIPSSTPFDIGDIKKFYFPQEFRCKKKWNTAVMFAKKEENPILGGRAHQYLLDGRTWIDYAAAMGVCHNFWMPKNLEDANALVPKNFFNELTPNPVFDIVNDIHIF